MDNEYFYLCLNIKDEAEFESFAKENNWHYTVSSGDDEGGFSKYYSAGEQTTLTHYFIKEPGCHYIYLTGPRSKQRLDFIKSRLPYKDRKEVLAWLRKKQEEGYWTKTADLAISLSDKDFDAEFWKIIEQSLTEIKDSIENEDYRHLIEQLFSEKKEWPQAQKYFEEINVNRMPCADACKENLETEKGFASPGNQSSWQEIFYRVALGEKKIPQLREYSTSEEDKRYQLTDFLRFAAQTVLLGQNLEQVLAKAPSLPTLKENRSWGIIHVRQGFVIHNLLGNKTEQEEHRKALENHPEWLDYGDLEILALMSDQMENSVEDWYGEYCAVLGEDFLPCHYLLIAKKFGEEESRKMIFNSAHKFDQNLKSFGETYLDSLSASYLEAIKVDSKLQLQWNLILNAYLERGPWLALIAGELSALHFNLEQAWNSIDDSPVGIEAKKGSPQKVRRILSNDDRPFFIKIIVKEEWPFSLAEIAARLKPAIWRIREYLRLFRLNNEAVYKREGSYMLKLPGTEKIFLSNGSASIEL